MLRGEAEGQARWSPGKIVKIHDCLNLNKDCCHTHNLSHKNNRSVSRSKSAKKTFKQKISDIIKEGERKATQ